MKIKDIASKDNKRHDARASNMKTKSMRALRP